MTCASWWNASAANWANASPANANRANANPARRRNCDVCRARHCRFPVDLRSSLLRLVADGLLCLAQDVVLGTAVLGQEFCRPALCLADGSIGKCNGSYARPGGALLPAA